MDINLKRFKEYKHFDRKVELISFDKHNCSALIKDSKTGSKILTELNNLEPISQ